MPAGSRTLLASGKRRISSTGKRVLSNSAGPCCCGPCDPDGNVCTDIECTSQAFTACCFQCGDTVAVTFGNIVASGVGTDAWIVTATPYVIAAVANQMITTTLQEVDKDPTPDGSSTFRWYSGELHRDTTHVYGARVSLFSDHRSAYGPAGIYWIVLVEAWRVPIADWNKAGPCQGVEFAALLSTGPSPTSDPPGTCCGQDEAPLTDLTEYITSADPATDITPDTGCGQLCDCDELPSSVLIEADCVTTTANRGSGECDFSASVTTGSIETCDLVETSITLRRSNSGNGEDEYFCGWVLEISITTYGLVGENCEPVSVNDIFATLDGNDPTGTYTIQTGTGCGTTIEIS